jgi:uncharacterized SAM-binding protein YcdF (DUF218 family)
MLMVRTFSPIANARNEPASTGHGASETARWWHFHLIKLYESLSCHDPAEPSDLIFVLAGRMERKQYGLELYRAGIAPRLVLSVGRFEVSKMRSLDLPEQHRLTALRDRTRPDERHFFVTIDHDRVSVEMAALRRWSTYGEALGLRRLLEKEDARRIIVVSTDVHLRRVAYTYAKVFADTPFKFSYCPVPTRFGFMSKDSWWARPNDRRFVLKEKAKLIAYRAILSLPAGPRDWFMRLNK